MVILIAKCSYENLLKMDKVVSRQGYSNFSSESESHLKTQLAEFRVLLQAKVKHYVMGPTSKIYGRP